MEFNPRRPKWAQVAEEIQRRIAAGEIGADDVISEVKLEDELGVSRPTIRQAMKYLRDELKLIETIPGRGSFIRLVDDQDEVHGGRDVAQGQPE